LVEQGIRHFLCPPQALECYSLLPLYPRELARGDLSLRGNSGQQAGPTAAGQSSAETAGLVARAILNSEF
jgi:hypothetical protein